MSAKQIKIGDRVFLTCSFTQNMQLHKKLCKSNKKAVQFKVYYVMAKGCMKIKSSKIGRFRYEMIGETQLEFSDVTYLGWGWDSSKGPPTF